MGIRSKIRPIGNMGVFETMPSSADERFSNPKGAPKRQEEVPKAVISPPASRRGYYGQESKHLNELNRVVGGREEEGARAVLFDVSNSTTSHFC
jgi:hypothetical protein